MNKGKSKEDIINACQLAETFDFIQKQPDQFNTMLEKKVQTYLADKHNVFH